MYCNVNFNVFFKLIKVPFFVSELYIYQNAGCNDKKNPICYRARVFGEGHFQWPVPTYSCVSFCPTDTNKNYFGLVDAVDWCAKNIFSIIDWLLGLHFLVFLYLWNMPHLLPLIPCVLITHYLVIVLLEAVDFSFRPVLSSEEAALSSNFSAVSLLAVFFVMCLDFLATNSWTIRD